jgi:hypothetical protein
MKKELKVGTKYLNIIIPFGDKNVKFTAFPNEDANETNNQPQYKGKNGLAVFVNKKKAPSEPKEELVA